MFVSIFGLPANIKYQDLKSLIKQQCNLIDIIVDNIVNAPDGTKKVRIGLADDAEAMRLVKALDGYRLQGNHVIKVIPIGKPQPNPPQQGYDQQYPPSIEFGNQTNDFRGPMNRPQTWAPAVPNVWSQETPIGQPPQNHGYQQQDFRQQATFQAQRPDAPYTQSRPQIEQFRGKPNVSESRRPVAGRPHVLRSVDIIDSSTAQAQQGRYPPNPGYPQHEKPGPLKEDLHGALRWEPNQAGPGHYQGPSQGEPQSWSHQRKPSPRREGMAHGRPVSPRPTGRPKSPRPGMHGRQSPGRPGLHGRLSPGRPYTREDPGRPMSPRHGGRMISPERPSRVGRPNPGIPGRPGSPKNFPDYGRPIDGRPGMAGRHISPGRHMTGRPDSPIKPGGRPLLSGKASPPGRHPMRTESPGMRPSGRPISPGARVMHDQRPGMGRPGSPGFRSGRPGSPAIRSGRPGSPGPRAMHDQRPGRARPGSPSFGAGRAGSPGMRPRSPGPRTIPDQRSGMGRPGSPGFRSGRPGSPGMRSGRPGSPGMRSGRPGSPGIRPGRPGSPRKIPPFHGRPISPGGRPMPDQRSGSPRRFGPGPPGRPGSPMRRSSPGQRRPGDRGDSPRRMSPHRYSPDRHHPDKHALYDRNSKSKLVRPAYDNMASSKGMYSGGFHPNEPWQKDDKYPKIDDERREGRIPPRVIDEEKRGAHPAERKSRSPIRRERSPLRDRFKRHSPSPRSPRRSWALEKRRSPEIREAPPPPVWPGQNRDDDQFPRRNVPDRLENEDNSKHEPVWEIPSENKGIDRRREDRRPEDSRRFEDKRDRRDIINPDVRERFAPQNERPDKFSPREIDDRHDFRRGPEKRFNTERQDHRDFQRRSADREGRHRDELPRQTNASPHHMDEQNTRKNFDKELEDVYKRAVEFRKRAESLRRSGERRGEGYDEDRHEDAAKTFEHSRRPSPPGRRGYPRSNSEERRIRPDIVEWKVEHKLNLPEHVRAKREKALKEIVNRLLERQTVCDYIEGEFEHRVREELNLEISKIIQNLFGTEDVSFIEIIIKYQAKFNMKDEELILRAVLNSLPTPNKSLKRSGPETFEVAAKTARRTSPTALKGETARPKLSDPNTVNWTANVDPPKLATVSMLSTLDNAQAGIINPMGISQFGMIQPMMLLGDNQQAMVMNQHLMASQLAMQMNEQMAVNLPTMVPAPFTPATEQQPEPKDSKGVFNLYLCQEDFQAFSPSQAEDLKRFLFSKIVEATESSRAWAPDITIKGLQSLHRYELQTKDSRSKDWLLNLDFSEFKLFTVVIYMKEELWYERAAIWLPGHSRNRNIDPLEKLKLQNKNLVDIDIGKWKLVKQIVNEKGTRLFVDMPPSSARALDKYKMMLSYELQKVNVLLRAVAVDKDTYDACMKEFSITDKSILFKAAQNNPFPVINNDPLMVKITLDGCKTMSIDEARKIKEVVIYNIFRYLQMGGSSRTDFVKYGFCQPNYFGIVPENLESRKWLLSRNLGKLKNNVIVVVGGQDDDEGKLIPMKIYVDRTFPLNPPKILERLKTSNKGIKGLNFNKWKVGTAGQKITANQIAIDVSVDIESLETLKKFKYQLDYVTDRNKTLRLRIHSTMPYPQLKKELKKLKSEQVDSYVVANMELDSDDENVISLD